MHAGPLLSDLGNDVADVMRELVPVDTGAMRAGIAVGDLDDDHVEIVVSRDVPGDDPKVPIYVERGTSKMAAQPFMRPALYRYRSP